jgi:hypothetical protein
MLGFITEEHLELAEESFPGIRALFLSSTDRPRTFLDLVARYRSLAAELARKSARS